MEEQVWLYELSQSLDSVAEIGSCIGAPACCFGAQADRDAYDRFLKPGAIVAFHDWGWAEGVKRVIRENVEPIVSSSDSLPNLWWGTIAQRL